MHPHEPEASAWLTPDLLILDDFGLRKLSREPLALERVVRGGLAQGE